jgi:alkaline phosphatase D
MHYAELSRWQPPQGYPIWDATSSGLTEVWDVPTPNGHRVSPVLAERNFGLLDIDCAQQRLHLQLCDAEGQPRFRHSIDWAQLRFST